MYIYYGKNINEWYSDTKMTLRSLPTFSFSNEQLWRKNTMLLPVISIVGWIYCPFVSDFEEQNGGVKLEHYLVKISQD